MGTAALVAVALLHTPMTWILAGSLAVAVLIENVVYTPRPTSKKEDSK